MNNNNPPQILNFISNRDLSRLLNINDDSNFEYDFINGFIEGTWDDEKFMENLVKYNGMYLEGGSERIRKNPKICILALKNNHLARKFIHPSIRTELFELYLKNEKEDLDKKKKNIQPTNFKLKSGFIREEVYEHDQIDNNPKIFKRVRTCERQLNNLTNLVS